MQIEYFLTIISFVGAIISIFTTIFSSYIQTKEEEKNLIKIKNADLAKIIDSSNIDEFEKFLDNTIGSISLEEYTHNKNISHLVDKYFSELTKFIGTDKEIKSENIPIARKMNKKSEIKFNEEFHKILNELNNGEVWNSLARLRHYIEKTLKEYIKINELSKFEEISLGRLTYFLFNKEIINKTEYENFKFVTYLCNRAVHGEEVTYKEAQEAIEISARLINKFYL
jgi:hypothetical protein